MAQAALPLAVASAGAQLFSGFGQSNALKSQAKAAEYRARQYELQGSQIAAARSDELTEALDSLNVGRASRNVNIDSPTALAMRKRLRKDAFEKTNAEVLGARVGVVNSKTEANAYRTAAPYAMIGGVARATGSLASGF